MNQLTLNEIKETLKAFEGNIAIAYDFERQTKYWDGRKFNINKQRELFFPVEDWKGHYENAVNEIRKLDDHDDVVGLYVYRERMQNDQKDIPWDKS